MKFDFDEDQQFIRNDARRFLVDRCPMEDVRQHLDSDPGVISPLWRELEICTPQRYCFSRASIPGLGVTD